MKEHVRQALMDALEGFGIFEEDLNLELERPKDPSHGDLTTNVALVLAKRLKRKPRELAGELAAKLAVDRDRIASVEIAGPGFINFRYEQKWFAQALLEVLESGEKFGRSAAGDGERVIVEFVSANPTGPLNVVSARAAAVGSALCRVLDAAGYRAHAEFYCNNEGKQVLLLGASLRARYAELVGAEDVSFPEDGYRGSYIVELAKQLAQAPDREPEPVSDTEAGKISGGLPIVEGSPAQWMRQPEEESATRFGNYALLTLIRQQRQTLRRFGLTFNAWYLESELHATEKLQNTLERLERGDHVYRKDGAVWFRSTDFDDEKDRVLVKADESPTYFLADIAYHASKRDRGFEHAIDIFGPDHHGHISRLEGAMQALGYPPDWLEILILQQVNLIQDGKPLEMSKRAGRLVTMDELIEEVGADVAKFFFLVRRNASHLDFDLDLAKKESNENPVYYVKYAHARICSVLRNAEAREIDLSAASLEDLERLTHQAELGLLRMLPELPVVVAQAARTREMSRLTQYAVEMAQTFHQFYHQCTILGDDPGLSRARLALARGSRIVLANTLRLIGVEAPERM